MLSLGSLIGMYANSSHLLTMCVLSVAFVLCTIGVAIYSLNKYQNVKREEEEEEEASRATRLKYDQFSDEEQPNQASAH